jgi:hypothetical protein
MGVAPSSGSGVLAAMLAGMLGALVLPRPAPAEEPGVAERGFGVHIAGLAVVLPALLGGVAFALHAAALGDWLIDDAGISFAYARNLATGHGLVAQPGAPPVEGFSNPLWTLLLAAAYALGAEAPLLVARALAAGLVTSAFACLVAAAREDGDRGWGAAVPPLLAACSTPFVAWAASGLENPLLAALAALAFLLAVRAVRGTGRAERLDLASGVVASLLALTRPDGIVYAAAYPFALFAAPRHTAAVRALAPRLLRYALGFAPPLASWLAFRLWWFGDWAPNTYYAKGGPELAGLFDVAKLRALLEGAAGPAAVLLAALTVAVSGLLGARRRLGRGVPVAGVYLAVSVAVYLLLPEDWMREFRFATPVMPFLAWLTWALARRSVRWLPIPGRGAALAGLAVGLVAAGVVGHLARTAAFAADPTIPIARVGAFAEGYQRLAGHVDAREASLLTADVGGMLLRGRLRIHDLAGLCDRTIARTLGGAPAAFHAYVFEELRPTFIHVHGHWAEEAALARDPRLGRDYAPLWEAFEAGDGRLAAQPAAPDQAPWSADYVRRDAFGDDPVRLAGLRRAFVAERLPWLGRDRTWRVGGAVLPR